MKDGFLDISKINKLSPEKGRVLISEPFMADEHFKRSVIYLCEHNEDGSFGFVMNNFLDISLSELVEDIVNKEFKVSFGGPVSPDNLFYVHTLKNELEGCYEVKPGLYTGGKFEDLIPLINTGVITPNEIRFFLGYSGWEAGQLDTELSINSWIVGKTTVNRVLNTHDKDLWKNILDEMGGKFKMISNFPEDPSLN